MSKVKDLWSDPFLALHFFLGVLVLVKMSFNKRIKISHKIKIIGRPIIDIREGARLSLGAGVTLNSRNKGYHINLFGPVKLFADKKGATIKIGEKTRIHGSCLHAYKSIVIGRNCLIAGNCQIIDCNGHDLSFDNVSNRINTKGSAAEIVIGDNVWIGSNTFILPGVHIGEGSVIGANSVVRDNIPSMVVASGNPARVLRRVE